MSIISLLEKSEGERVLMLRQKLGLSQQDFAAPLGLKKSYISRVENGAQSLSKPVIILMSYVYSINQEWLESGVGEMIRTRDEGNEEKGQAVETGTKPFDADVLRQVIEGLEEGLQEKGKVIEPAKKAELVILLYEHFIGLGDEVRSSTVERYLRLVS